MEQRRIRKRSSNSKHPSNYCKNCKSKVRQYRITCPYCGKFILSQLPILLLACAAFVVFIYLMMMLLSLVPPLEIPTNSNR